eukprot:g20579.t1
MLTSSQAARWLPRDFVEASQLGGVFTIVAYAVMLIVFMCELISFASPQYATVLALDKAGSDSLQINFDVDVHDIECRNLQVVVYAQNGKERLSSSGEVAEDHDKQMQDVRKQDGGQESMFSTNCVDLMMTSSRRQDTDLRTYTKELDSDWSSSHDGFRHKSLEHVIQGHDFTCINFFAGWCSHCQKFAPEWEKLADKVRNEVTMVEGLKRCSR